MFSRCKIKLEQLYIILKYIYIYYFNQTLAISPKDPYKKEKRKLPSLNK